MIKEEQVLFEKKTNHGTKKTIQLPDLKKNMEIGISVKDEH